MRKPLIIGLLITIFGALVYAQVAGTDPQTRYRDTDTSITTGGLWRWRFNGGPAALEMNTAAAGDFSAKTTPIQITQTGTVGVGPYVSSAPAWAQIHISAQDNLAFHYFDVASNTGALAGVIDARKSRGTHAARALAQSGDTMFIIAGLAYDNLGGTGFNQDNARIDLFVDESYSQGQTAPGAIRMWNNPVAASPAQARVNWTLQSDGRMIFTTPKTAPNDAKLWATGGGGDAGVQGSITFYLDEAGNALKVRVRYSDGSLRTGTVTLN